MEIAQGGATMTLRVLFGREKFGHAARSAIRCKHRIVAKPSMASRGTENGAFPTTAADERRSIVGITDERNHAAKARGPRAVGDIVHRLQQFLQISEITRSLTGVTRRTHAGRTAERIDLEPRIVRHRRQAAACGRMARLEQCIVLEGRAGLLRRVDAELRLRDELEPEWPEHLAELADLAGVSGGEDDAQSRELLSLRRAGLQRLSLQSVKRRNAARSELEHAVEFFTSERVSLCSALDLDERTAIFHDDVHVGLGL